MARKPKFLAKPDETFQLINGEKTKLQLSLVMNAIGNNQLTIFITAPSCTYPDHDDPKRQVFEIETVASNELIEFITEITVTTSADQGWVRFNLFFILDNADGKSRETELLCKVGKPDDQLA